MSPAEARENINGTTVARMVMEFQREFREQYPTDVHTSVLCAVGPLQSMIGLGIANGHLVLPAKSYDVPRCTSWLGHKFEGRYSKTAAQSWPKFQAQGKEMAGAILDAVRDITYERDVCIRCGATIERAPPNQKEAKE